jgi:hypothetical protein
MKSKLRNSTQRINGKTRPPSNIDETPISSNNNNNNNNMKMNPVGDTEEQVIAPKKTSTFEEMLQKELENSEAVVEDDGIRFCPFCKQQIMKEEFLEHRKHCKEKHTKKRKAVKIDVLGDPELRREANKLKKQNKHLSKKLPKKKNWKAKHNDFINAMKKSKGDTNVPELEVTDDRVYCELCGRKYNENVYDKHLPRCKREFEKQKIKNKGPANKSTKSSKSSSRLTMRKR